MSFLLGIIYLSFISLGLPDALLGFGMAEYVSGVSGSGVLCRYDFHDHCVWNDLSSLQSDRLTKRFGTGKVTAASVGLFRQSQLSPAVFMGDSLWTGSRKRRRFPE